MSASRKAVTLALLLSIAFPGSGAIGQDRAQTASVLETPDLRFTVDIDPLTVVSGKRIRVVFTISYAEGTRVYFPESPPVKPFVMISHERDSESVTGISTGERHEIVLLPVRVGTSVLAPIEVPYVTASGEARVLSTPEVRIQVGSTLGNEANPEMAPAGEPVPVIVFNTVLAWTIFGLAVAAVAAVLGIVGYVVWRRWRDAHRPPPPPRPPRDVALERLAAIDAMGLVEARDFKQLALLVSEVSREFLGAVFGFAGVDLTTWEVLNALSGKSMGRLTPVEVEDFLGFCDLIKFAKFVPSEDEAWGLTRRAREMVERVG